MKYTTSMNELEIRLSIACDNLRNKMENEEVVQRYINTHSESYWTKRWADFAGHSDTMKVWHL